MDDVTTSFPLIHNGHLYSARASQLVGGEVNKVVYLEQLLYVGRDGTLIEGRGLLAFTQLMRLEGATGKSEAKEIVTGWLPLLHYYWSNDHNGSVIDDRYFASQSLEGPESSATMEKLKRIVGPPHAWCDATRWHLDYSVVKFPEGHAVVVSYSVAGQLAPFTVKSAECKISGETWTISPRL